MSTALDKLSRAIGYRFADSQLLDQALKHRSAGSVNNERLEFLGDAILGFVIAHALYAVFADAKEGQLSRLRALLVKKETLAALARELELGQNLNLGAGELRSGGQSRDSILADALEAVFGAIFLDGGYLRAREVILRIFSNRLQALSLESQQKDPKTRLQEYLQARKQALPEYNVLEISGNQHAQIFRVSCDVSQLDTKVEGVGSSRRRAEQAAAVQMLQVLCGGD